MSARNQALLVRHIERVLTMLDDPTVDGLSAPLADMDGEPGPVERIASVFDLSPFERDTLVLLAAAELDCRVSDRFAGAPSVGQTLAALPGADWEAFSPGSPLRRWELVDLGEGETLATRCLVLAPRALFALMGVDHIDPRLERIIRLLLPPDPAGLPAASLEAAARAVRAWEQSDPKSGCLHLDIVCTDLQAAEALAAVVAWHLGQPAWEIVAPDLPTHAGELGHLIRLIEREAALGGGFVVVRDDDPDPVARRSAHRVVETATCPTIAVAPSRRTSGSRPTFTVELSATTTQERATIWRAVLGEQVAAGLGPVIEDVAHEFQLAPAEIAAAAAEAVSGLEACDDMSGRVWQAARLRARAGFSGLAHPVEPVGRWDDLVLPARQLEALAEIVHHVRRRRVVEQEWGIGHGRRLAVSALFSGPSGTGKTLAAEVVAAELRLDLLRIDLSAAVSKYLGETEKNLQRLFDAAERSGAVLLFDEADALFGRRSEVRDAHDRHANLEVSYLLQRLEAYRGLAILTTNLAEHIDDAFLRRIRHVVEFPFPDHPARRQLWAGVFPPATPVEGIDLDRLAQLSVTGGSILNMALAAAVLAVEAGSPVTMAHLGVAARREYEKAGRSPSPAEFAGWPA